MTEAVTASVCGRHRVSAVSIWYGARTHKTGDEKRGRLEVDLVVEFVIVLDSPHNPLPDLESLLSDTFRRDLLRHGRLVRLLAAPDKHFFPTCLARLRRREEGGPVCLLDLEAGEERKCRRESRLDELILLEGSKRDTAFFRGQVEVARICED